MRIHQFGSEGHFERTAEEGKEVLSSLFYSFLSHYIRAILKGVVALFLHYIKSNLL